LSLSFLVSPRTLPTASTVSTQAELWTVFQVALHHGCWVRRSGLRELKGAMDFKMDGQVKRLLGPLSFSDIAINALSGMDIHSKSFFPIVFDPWTPLASCGQGFDMVLP
jgi:hypothetical protein